MAKSHEEISYQERKVRHWMRFGTPAEIDPETGAAAPKWVLEERDARRKRERKAALRQREISRFQFARMAAE